MAIMNSQFYEAERSTAAERAPPTCHTETLKADLRKLNASPDGASPIVIDGYNVEMPDIVNAARYLHQAKISEDPIVHERIEASVKFLLSKVHQSIYGVTTGFGGSADTRTTDHLNLQLALLEHQLVGVLPSTVSPGAANMMPEAIVRGAMLIRVNSLVRGHSAVRFEVLEALVALLNLNITPCVPLRGSISASGDLSPLSYVASAICGHPDVKVIDRSSGVAEVLTAPIALKKHGLTPIRLGPKEGLGLINGTAFSASAGTLALSDAHFYAALTQLLTGMTVEAMTGMKGSFAEFIHDVTRPHPGQIEVARNLRGMLEHSKLAVSEEEEADAEADAGTLRQDRYPLRTSPQWLGPQLETLVLAHQQISIELNSTTDNPLIDVANGIIHHGGAFQAFSVTQAMEATRLTLEHFGKLAFSQLTELVNCTMNRGLPSCLAGGGNPSTNFYAKGLDIHSAAYQAELGFLASPVSTHVQSAEMANQAVNSMALASARKTIEANDVLGMLLSSHFIIVCQAIDLRVIDLTFRAALGKAVTARSQTHFAAFVGQDDLQRLVEAARAAIFRRLDATSSVDALARFPDVVGAAVSAVLDGLGDAGDGAFAAVAAWRRELAQEAARLYEKAHLDVNEGKVDVASWLGGSAPAYLWVRKSLGIKLRLGDVFEGKPGPTIGSSVSRIFEGLQTPEARRIVVGCLGA